MDPRKLSDYQTSYDRIAEEYAARIAGELEHKPLDRMLLDEFAGRVKAAGRVCELGCGPGHVARYLGLVGFAIEDSLERDPYAPQVEYQSRRAYIRACKPTQTLVEKKL